MKIQCYDNYKKQKLLIKIGEEFDDELEGIDTWNSKYCLGRIPIEFVALTDEDPNPKRWSDLSNFKII